MPEDDLRAARREYAESLGLYRSLSHTRGTAGTLLNLGNLCVQMGKLDDARRFYREATPCTAALETCRKLQTS